MPLYVRAGAILRLGPVKQYSEEKVEAPTDITIFPGADGAFRLYEDDCRSFDYRKGAWMGIEMSWNDARRTLSLKLEQGSRMLLPLPRILMVKLEQATRRIAFEGRQLEVKF